MMKSMIDYSSDLRSQPLSKSRQRTRSNSHAGPRSLWLVCRVCSAGIEAALAHPIISPTLFLLSHHWCFPGLPTTPSAQQCDKHQIRMNAPDVKKGASVFSSDFNFRNCFFTTIYLTSLGLLNMHIYIYTCMYIYSCCVQERSS